MNKPEKEYLDYLAYQKKYSPRSVDSYQRDLDKFFAFLGNEGIAMDDVDEKIVRNFIAIERMNGKTVLRVTFPDGTVIADKKAKVTFAETIKRIGLMRVRNLGISFCHVPLVSNTLDNKYGNTQIPVGNGLYVMTHSSTHDKKKQLDKIAKELGIKLIVEEI